MMPALAVLAACTALALEAKSEAVFDVMTYGAKGDGETDDSVAIAKAYAACRAHGGGGLTKVVRFASGRVFRSGPVELACNHTTTLIEEGAVLMARGTTDGWEYGPDCPEPAQGRTPKQMAPFLHLQYRVNVTVTGGGAVDALGEMWWKEACGNWWCPPGYSRNTPYAFRPYLFRIDHSVSL
jgi:polygalacturonase